MRTGSEPTLIRNPRKQTGKAHRASLTTTGATACGAGTRDMTETIPFEQAATEDKCQKCEKAVART